MSRSGLHERDATRQSRARPATNREKRVFSRSFDTLNTELCGIALKRISYLLDLLSHDRRSAL